MFVQIHMLQSMPPGNLNRDETGQPKKCLFGGVTRGRISSQCLKRNIRLSTQFKEAFGDALADRTTYLPRMVAEALKKGGDNFGVPDEEMNALMRALASKFQKEKGGTESEEAEEEANQEDVPNSPTSSADEQGKTGQLVFFQEPFARRIAELVAGLRKDRLPAYRYFLTGEVAPETGEDKAQMKARKDDLKKRKADLKKEERAADTDEQQAAVNQKKAKLAEDEQSLKAEGENKKDALKAEIGQFVEGVAAASKTLTVDIGLFGRMTTSDLVVNVEATCQVAHAISTHETIIESDYFTAMDDRKERYAATQTEKAGAAFMGTGDTETFYNAAVYYKYLNLDIDALRKHLPSLSDKAAGNVAGVLVSAAALATPTGKQNSFASHSAPELILVEVSKTKRPISYANAFLQPVDGPNFLAKSAEALKVYLKSVAAAFAPADVQRFLLAVGHAKVSLEGAQQQNTLDELANAVGAAAVPQKGEARA